MLKIINVYALKKFIKYQTREDKYYDLYKNTRAVAKLNPFKGLEFTMWEEQCYVNYPILYLGSIYLYLYAKQNNKKLFLFATRDCCHWQRIFSKLFPNEKTVYFDCSRIMFDRANISTKSSGSIAYIKYIESIMVTHNEKPETSIYVDVHGSGHRMFNLFEKYFQSVPDCFLLTARFADYNNAQPICQKYHLLGKYLNIAFETSGSSIEMLNYDVIGTLQNYSSDNRAIRDSLEYQKELINPYHKAMKNLIENTKNITARKKEFTMDELDSIIKNIFMKNNGALPIISKKFSHLKRHQPIS